MNTTTACNIVKSWLRANEIPFTPSTTAGCHLTVEGRLGDIEVRFCTRSDETKPGLNVLDVLTKDIGHKQLDVVLGAYHSVTSAAGFGKPDPLNRGVEPEQKLCYTDDEFLVGVRHTEVRRSPNASLAKFQTYDKTMHKACWTFYNINNRECRRWGKSVEDLMSYAMTMLNTFVSRIENEEATQAFNEQTLYVWLRQRFAEIYRIECKKELSTSPDADTVSIGLLNRTYGGRMTYDSDGEVMPITAGFASNLLGAADMEEVDDKAYKARHCKLDTSNPTARKASAAKLLAEELGKLGHDKMVAVLEFAKQNILISSDARREAAKQLRNHGASCSECGPVSSEVDVDEETGLESLSTEE